MKVSRLTDLDASRYSPGNRGLPVAPNGSPGAEVDRPPFPGNADGPAWVRVRCIIYQNSEKARLIQVRWRITHCIGEVYGAAGSGGVPSRGTRLVTSDTLHTDGPGPDTRVAQVSKTPTRSLVYAPMVISSDDVPHPGGRRSTPRARGTSHKRRRASHG